MPRFETESQFWEITRAGASITTRTGKLANRGRTATKLYPSIAEAARAYDDLVVDRRTAGFTRVDEQPDVAVIAGRAREAEDLEAAIDDDPTDPAAYLVYADALQREGDPRGELITLQIAAEREAAAKATRSVAGPAAGKLLAAQVGSLLGPLAESVADVRDLVGPPFGWRFGFIHRVELVTTKGRDLAALLDQVLAHPSGRFVVELVVRCDGHAETTAVLDAVARARPPTLRELDVRVTHHEGGLASLGELWPAIPRLERLGLVAHRFALGGLALPHARRARFGESTFSEASTVAVAHAPWPVLQRLELDLSNTDADFVELQPLLVRTDMPALTHLRIRGCAFAGAITRGLIDTAIARQLHVLDLSHGEINPGDAERLARAAASFPALRELWLPLDRLRAQDVTALRAVAKHVISDRRAPLAAF
ncbi:MAG: TIGR02996 domain-containing protein [Kofleriaceae bacterium]